MHAEASKRALGPGPKALLAAIPAAAVSIALVEFTRVLFTVTDPLRSLAALGLLLGSVAPSFLVPAVLLALTAAALATRVDVRAKWALLIGLAAAQVFVARLGLVAYPPFAWSVPVNLALFVAWAGISALHLWLQRPSRRAGLVGLLLALGCLLLVRTHYFVYVGLYPTLHQLALQLGFVGVALGISLALASRPWSESRGRLAVVAGLVVVALAFLEPPGAQEARPLVTAHTELGRGVFVARALARDRAYLQPTELPPPRRGSLLRPDDSAEARFVAQAGFPMLPGQLGSYDVLLVISESTRFDRTSLADPERRTTPRLLELASRGAHVFTRAYSPSNGTFPSLASMLTMRPLSFADVDIRPRPWRGRLRPGRPTAAELFGADGRRTFWVGHDHRRCFTLHMHGLERGFDERVLIEERRADPRDVDVDLEIADAAVDAIERGPGRFFGLVFFVSPHDDYRGGYDAEIRRFDAALGRVLDAVDLERTVVIVTSDHGEAFGEHGNEHHLSSVYDEQIHVPLVMWVPGSMGRMRHAGVTSTSYVLPWLLLRGSEPQRAGTLDALREDVGPLLRELDGAVISEMIGLRSQQVALIWNDSTVVYDVLAELPRVFDADDQGQRVDLREWDGARFERLSPLIDRYRRARYGGRRFRFVAGQR